MRDTFRDSTFGQIVRLIGGKKLFPFPEERPGFEVPARYRRDEKTLHLLRLRENRSKAVEGAKKHREEVLKKRDEMPVRIAPVSPPSEDAMVSDAVLRADIETARQEKPVRIAPPRIHEGDLIDVRQAGNVRPSLDSEATRYPSQASGDSRMEQVDPNEELGIKEGEDPNIVDWYGPDDPENPLNFSLFKKCFVTFCIALITISVYMGSSIVTPGILDIVQEFGKSQIVATLVLALFVLGYGTGPLILSPLSEIPSLGRTPIYIVTLFLFMILQVPTALVSNFAGFCILRFLAGFIGSPPLATGGASVGDMFGPKTRTYALGAWGIAAVSGPAVGPIVAGFAVNAKTWRWAFWEMLWLSGFSLVFLFFLLPETSSQTILLKRAKRLRKLTGNGELKSKSEIEQSQMTPKQVAKMTLLKPFQLNFSDPILFALNLYIAFVYAVLYSWFEAFPLVYEQMYGMSLPIAQLPFAALLVGSIVSLAGYFLWHKYWWIPRYDAADGKIAPELRLPPAFVGALCLPICLFPFAWSSGRTHWMAPVAFSSVFSAGATLLFSPIINYIQDAYPDTAASALAANDFFRSVFGAAMPIVASPLFKNLKVDWGCSLLGFISLVFIPIPIFLYKFGKVARKHSKYAQSPV
ncbi:hypothetical protein NliqN6_3722 [Naganishia liquefaciens]|uniref:Major facilitator superfamily (MFS) profile domain-containing protein n=1 Tax=Naganishia liquefaciens TaxID=104408 RepID=A0A8H3TU80_9TREE|nr:hypothetical protein NliqN6_3722 [Naganishia liquefaciens]